MSSLSLLLLFLFLAYIPRDLYQAYASPLRDIPGPWLARFTRLWLLKATGSGSFEKTNTALHRKYGPIVRLAPNEYSIDDPEAAKIIYRSKNQLPKARKYSVWDPPDSEPSIFTHLDIARHAERRRQVSSLYGMSAVTAIEYQVDIATSTFIEKMKKFARAGAVVDLAEWMQYYAFDTVAYLTFGISFGFLQKGGDVANIMRTIDRFARYGGRMGVYSEWHPFIFRLMQLIAPAGAAVAAIHAIAAQVIRELGPREVEKPSTNGNAAGAVAAAEQDTSLRNDYIRSLLARHRTNPAAFAVGDIYYHTVPHVIAGGETTGIALAAAVYFLLKQPRVLAKLRGELDAYTVSERKAEGLWTMKEAQECVYLQAVIKEALRLFPSVGLGLPRVVPRGGLMLAGRAFGEGTVVAVNVWVAHANREVFGEDAEAFRPERWMEADWNGEGAGEMEWYFFTFGRGSRTCIGKNISLLEINKLLPEIVQRFNHHFANHDAPKNPDGDTEMGREKGWRVKTEWFFRPRGFRVKVETRERGRENHGKKREEGKEDQITRRT